MQRRWKRKCQAIFIVSAFRLKYRCTASQNQHNAKTASTNKKLRIEKKIDKVRANRHEIVFIFVSIEMAWDMICIVAGSRRYYIHIFKRKNEIIAATNFRSFVCVCVMWIMVLPMDKREHCRERAPPPLSSHTALAGLPSALPALCRWKKGEKKLSIDLT